VYCRLAYGKEKLRNMQKQMQIIINLQNMKEKAEAAKQAALDADIKALPPVPEATPCCWP